MRARADGCGAEPFAAVCACVIERMHHGGCMGGEGEGWPAASAGGAICGSYTLGVMASEGGGGYGVEKRCERMRVAAWQLVEGSGWPTAWQRMAVWLDAGCLDKSTMRMRSIGGGGRACVRGVDTPHTGELGDFVHTRRRSLDARCVMFMCHSDCDLCECVRARW